MQLSHGNLVPVFDSGQVGGEIFLAMDFVEGKDLRAVWNRCAKKGVAFPVDVAVYIVKELARGLDYAHAFGDLKLVHRDVSPPNVLLSYTGEVKLTDFGLASSTLKLEKTAPGIIYGKVSYMSPEQARGEELDGRTDLYAAGIILWELLTGRQLFPSASRRERPRTGTRRRRSAPRAQPRARAAVAARAARAARAGRIALKALAPDLKERYASCEEMRHALATFLAQTSPATDTGAPGELPPRAVRRGHCRRARRARDADREGARVVLRRKRRRRRRAAAPSGRQPAAPKPVSARPPPLPSQKPPTPDATDRGCRPRPIRRATIRRGDRKLTVREPSLGFRASEQGEPRCRRRR